MDKQILNMLTNEELANQFLKRLNELVIAKDESELEEFVKGFEREKLIDFLTD